jgi:hypothetical protein
MVISKSMSTKEDSLVRYTYVADNSAELIFDIKRPRQRNTALTITTTIMSKSIKLFNYLTIIKIIMSIPKVSTRWARL